MAPQVKVDQLSNHQSPYSIITQNNIEKYISSLIIDYSKAFMMSILNE